MTRKFILLTDIPGEFCENKELLNYPLAYECSYESLNISKVSRSVGTRKTEEYSILVYNKFLHAISKMLNNLHKREYPDSYWEILVGSWLRLYTYNLLMKYCFLKDVNSFYGKFRTFGLLGTDYIFPIDTIEYHNKSQSDYLYNLQLYTKLIKMTNYAELAQMISVSDKKDPNIMNGGRKSGRLSLWLWHRYLDLTKPKKKRMLFGARFNKKTALLFSLASFGSILNLPTSFFSSSFYSNIRYDNRMRSKLALPDTNACNLFENCLCELLKEDLPTVFVEGYEIISREARRLIELFGRFCLISAYAWHNTEIFKAVAAEASIRGIGLYGIQHGGDYCTRPVHNDFDLEVKIVKEFYSWGKEHLSDSKKLVQMPMNKVIPAKKYRHKIKQHHQDILFALTAHPKYYFPPSYIPPHDMPVYHKKQIQFLSSLSDEIRENVYVRVNIRDYDWKIRENILLHFPDIRIENWDIPFFVRLKTIKLFICDNLQTTHLEALALNVPTILYWDPTMFEVTEKANKYYGLLRKAGILFDSPVPAARAVCFAQNNIQEWWYNPRRQQAVTEFCENIGFFSDNAATLWFTKIMKMY